MDWRPDIGDGDAPAYQRIVEALAADIERGALTPGARLPTQRALAHRLGLGIGTVTRAYAEAGPARADRGRRSGAAASSPATRAPGGRRESSTSSRNLPPMGPARAALRGGARQPRQAR